MTSSLVEFSNNLADVVQAAGAFVIGVPEGGREGVSGTLWRDQTAVVAAHTIRGHDELTVVLSSGEKAKAQVAGRDHGTDIAVLKLEQKVSAATLGDESQARVGEIVFSIGRRGADGLAVTYGVISAIGGPWRTWQGARVDRHFRLDLNPFTGFSGGPIINARGEVLGIATSGPRRSVMTIPTATVNNVVNQLLQRGRVARGYFGIGVQPVGFPKSTHESLGLKSERGLLIITIAPGSPAESSGLLLGDIIVAVGDAPVRGVHSLQPALDTENVGKSVTLEIVRGGKVMKLPVTVGEKQES